LIRSSSRSRPAVSAFFPILLIVVTALALLARLPAVVQPLGIDQSLWASAVRGLERGQRLYVDVWEQRPPGIYLTYWAAFKTFGWTPAAVAWLDIICSVITTVTLYLLGRILGGRLTGAASAAIFATMTMPAWMYRNGGFIPRSISETFIVTCVGLAALCGVAYSRSRSTAAILGFGLVAGAATIYKPNAAIYFPAIIAWVFWLSRTGGHADTRGWLKPILMAVGGAAIVPLLVVLWLWRIDVLADAKIAVVDFNRWYVSAGFDLPVYVRTFADFVGFRLKTAPEPLWIAGVAGAFAMVWEIARRRRLAPLPALALAWGGAAVLVIVVNGMRLYYTYFVQALAPLALVAGWWLTTWWQEGRVQRLIVAVVLAVSAVVLVQRSYVPKVWNDLISNIGELSGRGDHAAFLARFGGYGDGGGYSAQAHEELAAYVRAHTTPEDRIFLIGINGAGVYFLSDRLTAHRFLRVNFFVPGEFPDPKFTLEAVVEDLRERRPAYLIFERLHSDSDMGRAADALPEHPLMRSLLESYTLEVTIEDFTLYRRR
jgi:branched-subunit amino acid transport protein